MRLEIPLWIMVVVPLLCAASVLVRWRVNFYWTPLFVVFPLVWISFVYVATIFSWLDMDQPAVRAAWVRPGLLILFLALTASNLIIARQGVSIRRMINGQR